MLKKVLVIAGVFGASVAMQAPAQADTYISGGLTHANHDQVIDHQSLYRGPKHFEGKQKHHKRGGYGHALTNRELRYVLRQRGLRQIRIHSRQHGIAHVSAYNVRGYIARYKVSTRNGRILDGRVVRYINDRRPYDRPLHGEPSHRGGHFSIYF